MFFGVFSAAQTKFFESSKVCKILKNIAYVGKCIEYANSPEVKARIERVVRGGKKTNGTARLALSTAQTCILKSI